MSTITKNDSINKLQSTPYKEFFGAMRLSKAQLRERIALAEDIEDTMLVLFALYPHYLDNIDNLKTEMIKMLNDTITDHVVVDANVSKRIETLVNEVIDSTGRHADYSLNSKNVPPSTTKKETTSNTQGNSQVSNDNSKNYWLSNDRAMLIAENESNTIFNYSDYLDAVASGYTKKTWYTMLDERVRDTHIYLESETIDIDDVFVVGGSIMRFPHDTEYGAEAKEFVNCRCICEYS